MNPGTSEVTKAAFNVLVLQIKQLTEERDEARREVCQWSSESDKKFTPEEDADLRKWDCYKETK